MRNLCITQGFPCGFTVSVNPPVYFGRKSRTTFFFKFTHLFKIGLTRIIYLGANRGTLLLNEVGSGKMRRQRKKGEQKRSLHLFSAREKMVTDHASVADIRPWQLGQPRKQLRPPRRIEQMSFSVVCPTNFTVRRSYNYKNMYSLYVLSRNFEPAGSAEWSYCWILCTTVRSGAEERRFWGAWLDVLIFRLRSYHVLISYSAECIGPKFHKTLMFLDQAGMFLSFQARRSSAKRSSTSDLTVLNLRTIEKRKDWIWIGFQSGPPFFVRLSRITCYWVYVLSRNDYI